MEDSIIEKISKEPYQKGWRHLAVRPSTFSQFRILRGATGDEKLMASDDAFLKEVIRVYVDNKKLKVGEIESV